MKQIQVLQNRIVQLIEEIVDSSDNPVVLIKHLNQLRGIFFSPNKTLLSILVPDEMILEEEDAKEYLSSSIHSIRMTGSDLLETFIPEDLPEELMFVDESEINVMKIHMLPPLIAANVKLGVTKMLLQHGASSKEVIKQILTSVLTKSITLEADVDKISLIKEFMSNNVLAKINKVVNESKRINSSLEAGHKGWIHDYSYEALLLVLGHAEIASLDRKFKEKNVSSEKLDIFIKEKFTNNIINVITHIII